MKYVFPNHQPQSKQITLRPKELSPLQLDKESSKAIEMRFYWIKYRVKQKYFFVYWKPGSHNMGNYFMKHNPPHHHREIRATYLYVANSLLTINHKVVQEWKNSVLTPKHTVVLVPNHKVVQGCANCVCTYGHTKPTTVMYTV